MRKLSIAIMAIGLTVCASVWAKQPNPLKLSPYPRVYLALDAGITVTVIPIESKQDKATHHALVKVQGVNTVIDNVVLRYDVKQRQSYYGAQPVDIYTMTWQGQSQRRLVSSGGWYSSYTLYLPGSPQHYTVFYDAKRSKKVDIAAFKKAYQDQLEKGLQKKFATFDVSASRQRVEKDIQAKATQVATLCHTPPIKVIIDWSTIDNEQLKTKSVVSYCGAPLEALEQFCQEKSYYQRNFHLDGMALAKPTQTLHCQVKNQLHLTQNPNGTLNWTTAWDVPNQTEFVRNNLMNNTAINQQKKVLH